MKRIRGYLAELPPEIDTRGMEQILDRYQGTMVLPIYQETKLFLKHRIDRVIAEVSRIDRSVVQKFMELAEGASQLAWQYQGLVQMIGKGSSSLNLVDFQKKLNLVMELGERHAMRELIRIEDGAFVYQWSEISRLLERKTISEQELEALLEVLKRSRDDMESTEALSQQWLTRISQALAKMEPGSHGHLAALLQQCKELSELGVITPLAYAELESQYLWYQLSKLEQMQTVCLSDLEANKEQLMNAYGMTEEEFNACRENMLVIVELWELYEADINAYQQLSLSQMLEQSSAGRNPGADFTFLVQMGVFTTQERLDRLNGMKDNGGILSDELYQSIVGKKDETGYAMAWIQLTYNSSADGTTFSGLMKEVNQQASEQRLQLMTLWSLSGHMGDHNPAPYDGNLDPNSYWDRMELNSKNGFKNYDYVPLSPETLDWLRENDTSLNLVIEGSGNPKEVNIHGKINTELDEVGLVNKIIYEDKSANKLYMDNPDFPQTESQWAYKQVYKKGTNRIQALQQTDMTLSSTVSDNLPEVSALKDIKEYVFRIDADTPELRAAVQVELDNLKLDFSDYNFSATFGGEQ